MRNEEKFKALRDDLDYIQANIDAIRKLLDDPNAKTVDIQMQAENLREAAMSIDLQESNNEDQIAGKREGS